MPQDAVRLVLCFAFLSLIGAVDALADSPRAARQKISQQCEWVSGFHGTGPSHQVFASVVFDDGSGPALYVGGRFQAADDVAANHVAKWDGDSWSALGPGLDGEVRALTVFDEGTGPALYAAGNFTTAGGIEVNRIAKWDGASWSALGGGLDGSFSTV